MASTSQPTATTNLAPSTSMPAGGTGDSFAILTSHPDPTSIRQNCLADEKWNNIQILWDSQYKHAHGLNRFVLVCSCKETLHDALCHLRLLNVKILRTVNQKTWDSICHSMKDPQEMQESSAEATHEPGSVEDGVVALLEDRPQDASDGRAPALGEPVTGGATNLEWNDEPGVTSCAASILASGPHPHSEDHPQEASPAPQIASNDAKQQATPLELEDFSWTGDSFIDYPEDDAEAQDVHEAPAHGQVETTLPQSWSIVDRLKSSGKRVKASPLVLAQRKYERFKAEAAELSQMVSVTSDPDAKQELMLRLESALRSTLHARKDVMEKTEIQKFRSISRSSGKSRALGRRLADLQVPVDGRRQRLCERTSPRLEER
ncbi:hypothetical protein FRB90_009633 [Tulasnella sp. 427]|nr:hypothetical protein FRB90_009633 [Tulasnella sp. 427]